MPLDASGKHMATEKQPATYASMPPNVCLIPAPPPPSGPKGIPTPFPITTTTKSVVKSPAAKIEHRGSGAKLMNIKSVCDGIKGNESGVGSLPPGTPKKDVVTGVNRSKAQPFKGNTSVKIGGKACAFVGSMTYGNIK